VAPAFGAAPSAIPASSGFNSAFGRPAMARQPGDLGSYGGFGAAASGGGGFGAVAGSGGFGGTPPAGQSSPGGGDMWAMRR